jgi:hypothetical protein
VNVVDFRSGMAELFIRFLFLKKKKITKKHPYGEKRCAKLLVLVGVRAGLYI